MGEKRSVEMIVNGEEQQGENIGNYGDKNIQRTYNERMNDDPKARFINNNR